MGLSYCHSCCGVNTFPCPHPLRLLRYILLPEKKGQWRSEVLGSQTAQSILLATPGVEAFATFLPARLPRAACICQCY